ncbi:MAG: flagellar biosynthetic protein FliQ [Hyphomicrobium sp.]
MTDIDALEIVQKAIWVTMAVAGPVVISAMIVGIAVAFFQALTQVQEMTLTFVPKMLVAVFIISISGTYSGSLLLTFTEEIYSRIATGF